MAKLKSKTKKISKSAPSKKSNKNFVAKERKIFPIVGIGASAGGLEAFKDFLEALPADTGMGFVLVQHLDPTHESLAPQILARSTTMPVCEVKDGMRVEPNQIYVIPPNYELELLHGVLNLLPRRSGARPPHMGIDSFFRSLALDQKARAIGVILSGTATDGTHGLEAIKYEGGLAIAQDPKTTKFSGMPESAIASGFVDLILSPKEMAKELARIAKHPYIIAACESAHASDEQDDEDTTDDLAAAAPSGALQKIFISLRKHKNIDFSNYKLTTINRRIQRRMMVLKSESVDDYADYLQENPKEVTALYNDILINVTQFFRDPATVKVLQEQVLRPMVKNRKADTPIRVWVPGCASGEEAYSLAILLLEVLKEAGSDVPVQIFATDISEQAIQKARAGVYPTLIEQSVSKDRLALYFQKFEGGYKINKSIRDLCLFSKHDVTSDPPFSKLDLISCRNVLIYFDVNLQKRVLPVFHYALKSGGVLWLGKSEGIGSHIKLFSSKNKTHKIFSKVDQPRAMAFRFPLGMRSLDFRPFPKKVLEQDKSPIDTAHDYQKEAERIALAKYVPPSVTVNSEMEILQFQGRTVPYLEPSAGAPSNQLFKMARSELVSGLRTAIRAAMKDNKPARQEGLAFALDGQRRTVNVEVVPANPLAPKGRRNFVIFFEDVSTVRSGKSFSGRKSTEKKSGKEKRSDKTFRDRLKQQISELEDDLASNKLAQLSMTAEYEASQEELTAANEELQSTNEELQSSNEEMETAKEELQSTNEELNTVNDELQIRNADLTILSSDLSNILIAVGIPILIIGSDHRIRRFTPRAEKIFNLIASDVGRPLRNIKPNFDFDLEPLIANVTQFLTPQEQEIQTHDGQWFRLQVRPYKTIDNRIDGVLIAMVDITDLKERLTVSQAARKHAASIADTLELPLIVLDEELRLVSANHGFATLFEIDPEQMVGADLLSILGGKGWEIPFLRQRLTDVITENNELKNYEAEHEFPNLGRRIFLLNARQIDWQDNLPKALLLSMDDITERKKLLIQEKSAHAQADLARAEAVRANEAKDVFMAILSHELRTPLTTILSWAQLIQKQKFDPVKLQHGIQMIEQSAKSQGQLIDDLLDVSRIQTGKLSLKFMNVDPHQSVSSAIEAVRLQAENKQITIKTDVMVESKVVWGDTERLRQIVWNLLTNAIKFSPKGGTITVRLAAVKDSGKEFISLQVIDQGKGIEPDFLPKIFDRFSQADSSSIRVHGGLGLGLALVSELVALHHGTVTAQSEGLGKGAIFTVVLPVKTETAEHFEQPKLKTELEEGISKERPNLKGLRVLIVEDEVSTLNVLCETLNSFGAEVLPCTTATEALAAFKDFKPDVLLSDIAMPDVDGYSLIRNIRSLGRENNSNVPALALTAYSTAEDVQRAMTAGFDAHMAKPFETFPLGHEVLKLSKIKQR